MQQQQAAPQVGGDGEETQQRHKYNFICNLNVAIAAPRHGVTPTHRHTDKVCAEMEPWDKWSPIVIQTPHLNWWPAWLHSTLHSRCCTGQNNEESCIKILVRDPATTATGPVTRGM